MTPAQLDIVADHRLKEMLACATSLGCGALNGVLEEFGVTLPPEMVAKGVIEVVKICATAFGLSVGNVHIEVEEAVIRVK